MRRGHVVDEGASKERGGRKSGIEDGKLALGVVDTA